MNDSPLTAANIGLALIIIIALAGVDKRLRSDKSILIVGIVTLAIGLVGLLIRSDATDMPRGNAADFLFGPFVYVLSYSLLRKLYKSIYNVEPTYVWLNTYDLEDMRKVNLLDKVVHVLPLLLGMGLPFMGKLI
jgi:hypothetical protein